MTEFSNIARAIMLQQGWTEQTMLEFAIRFINKGNRSSKFEDLLRANADIENTGPDKPMTSTARKRYIASAGTGRCPYCKASDNKFDYGEMDPVEGGDIEQKVQCGKCKRRWTDVYQLIDVRELFS